MGVHIPDGYGLLSIGTSTPEDPEPMFWTLGVDESESAGPQLIAQAAADAWDGTISLVTSNTVQLTIVRYQRGPVPAGGSFEVQVTTSGDDGGALFPPNVAVLVKKLTGVGGAANRGRAYLPGVSSYADNVSSAGVMIPGEALVISNACNAFLAALAADEDAGPLQFVVLHESEALAPTPITSLQCQQRLATQRRRLRP